MPKENKLVDPTESNPGVVYLMDLFKSPQPEDRISLYVKQEGDKNVIYLEPRNMVLVHADGGTCHGGRVLNGRCVICKMAPDTQSVELWPSDQAREETPTLNTESGMGQKKTLNKPTFTVDEDLVKIDFQGIPHPNGFPWIPNDKGIVGDLLRAMIDGTIPKDIRTETVGAGRFIGFFRRDDAPKVIKWLEERADRVERNP